MKKINNEDKFDKIKGRLIIIDGIKWKWKIGKGYTVVARNQIGEKKVEHAATIKGMHSDDFIDGLCDQGTKAGLLPSEVAKWLKGGKHGT